MLFNYPTFISEKEQTKSELLFNNVRILIQTHVQEICFNTEFGTNIRDKIKQGIDDFTISDIRDEIETKLLKYFSNDLRIEKLNAWQEIDKVKIELMYTELKTGISRTIQDEEIITNSDTTLY